MLRVTLDSSAAKPRLALRASAASAPVYFNCVAFIDFLLDGSVKARRQRPETSGAWSRRCQTCQGLELGKTTIEINNPITPVPWKSRVKRGDVGGCRQRLWQ